MSIERINPPALYDGAPHGLWPIGVASLASIDMLVEIEAVARQMRA